MLQKEKVKEIVIIFENCENYKLKPDMFKFLLIQGEKVEKCINCCQFENGELLEYKTCEYFHIKINEKGLNQKGWLEKSTLLNRVLDYSDITSIELIYENDEKEQIHVEWNKENEYTNSYQENNYDEDEKTLEITIEKKGEK